MQVVPVAVLGERVFLPVESERRVADTVGVPPDDRPEVGVNPKVVLERFEAEDDIGENTVPIRRRQGGDDRAVGHDRRPHAGAIPQHVLIDIAAVWHDSERSLDDALTHGARALRYVSLEARRPFNTTVTTKAHSRGRFEDRAFSITPGSSFFLFSQRKFLISLDPSLHTRKTRRAGFHDANELAGAKKVYAQNA